MDFDYDGVEDLGGRILWGRIIVFGVALLVALLLGRCSAGGGADPDELAAAQAQTSADAVQIQDLNTTVTGLQQRVADLQQQLAAAQQGGGLPDASGDAAGDDTTGTTTPPTGGGTYVVQPGDTLSGIAAQVYGNAGAFGPIAEANGINETNPLQVGQELTIPANPDA